MLVEEGKTIVDEIWLDIDGYEGVYQISTNGRVRRFWRNTSLGYKILKQWTNKKTGYQRIDLCINCCKNVRTIHQLVLETFVGPRKCKMEGRHLDGNKQNNQLHNLRWGTKSENQRDRVIHGTTNRGKGNTKLTHTQILDIRQLLTLSIYSHKAIAAMFGVCRSTITDINTGRNWKGK